MNTSTYYPYIISRCQAGEALVEVCIGEKDMCYLAKNYPFSRVGNIEVCKIDKRRLMKSGQCSKELTEELKRYNGDVLTIERWDPEDKSYILLSDIVIL